jgi:diacylglycerol kinase (ATP)
MRIDLVLNPGARLYRRDPSLLDRMRRVAERHCDVHVTGSIEEMDAVANQIAQRGSDLVLLSGGDGTLMAGVTALHRAFDGRDLPPIAPVPGGTAGTVARNWGLSGDPTRCLQRLLEKPRRTTAQPSLRIKTQGDGLSERVGFIVGTGLVAKFFGVYYQRGAPGYAGSARIVARVFLESFIGGPLARRVLDPLPCRLEVEGRELDPEAWSLICSAVVKNLGIHMMVTYRAAEDPERPHLVATPMRPRDLGPRAHRVLAGWPIGGEHHVDQLVRTFAITFADTGPFVLDGELLHAHRIEVTPGPRLQIALPAAT